MDLQQYERFKFDLADVLRATAASLPPRSEIRQNEVRDLFARLAEDRFNVVVVGRFSRGKSTLMNAILGMDRLLTGVVPLTSVITTVRYGSDEKVVLFFQNSSLFSDIPLAELGENITERGNPGNIKRIRTAEVQLPADILRRGFLFIDTPGLGSSIVENTQTTEAFLPQADAFILVTSYDSPLSEEELRTLETIRQSGRRCFVVLNKQDNVSDREAAEVRAHVGSQLAGIFGGLELTLFSVSARQAMAAREGHDSFALTASGLPTLEDALVAFLVNEKHREFLIGMINRIAALGRTANAPPDIAQRLDTLKRRFSGQSSESDLALRPDRDLSTGVLPECEVCRHVNGEVFNFLARFQRLLREDADAQARHAASGGSCGPHTVQFEALAARRETCTGFAPVLRRQANRLRQAAIQGGTSSRLCDVVIGSLPTEVTCEACQVALAATSHAVQNAADLLATADDTHPQLQSVFCLPHVAELLLRLPQEIGCQILERQASILDRLADDMKRFALKQDGSKRHLASREENAAAKRGLRALLGDPNAATGPPNGHPGENVEWMFRHANR